MLTITLPNLKLALWDLHDQGSFGIVDLSSYSPIPSSADVSMQITPPGYPTVNVTFNPGKVNIYKCADLGITCGPTECCPLPDGIYDVKYSVKINTLANTTPSNLAKIEKTFIKVDQLLCKYDHVFAKVDMYCNCGEDKQRQYKHVLDEVDLMIASCVSAANACDPKSSFLLYKKADDILDKICCEFGMTCGSTFSCPQCQ